MTDEAQEAPRPQMVAQAAAAENPQVREMMNAFAEQAQEHLQGFIGQPNTPQVTQRMREYIGAAFEGAMTQTTQTVDDPILADVQRRGLVGTLRVDDTLTGPDATEADRNFRAYTAGTTANFITSSTHINNISTLAKESFRRLSKDDERLVEARKKAEIAYKDLDYLKCYECLGEFLEISGHAKDGRYRVDGGNLPNYVPVSQVKELVGLFMEHLHRVANLRKNVKSILELKSTDPSRVTVDYLLDWFQSESRNIADPLRWACQPEVGDINPDTLEIRGNGELRISIPQEDDEFGEAEEAFEELTEAQRMVVELGSALRVQEREMAHGFVRPGDVPEPVRGFGEVTGGTAVVAGNTGWVTQDVDTIEPDEGPQTAAGG